MLVTHLSLFYANLCKGIQVLPKTTILMQIMTNDIQRQLYFHVCNMKANISADIGNIFSYTLTDASSLCKFLEKNYQIAKKYHYRARAPLLRQKLICYNLRNTHSN